MDSFLWIFFMAGRRCGRHPYKMGNTEFLGGNQNFRRISAWKRGQTWKSEKFLPPASRRNSPLPRRQSTSAAAEHMWLSAERDGEGTAECDRRHLAALLRAARPRAPCVGGALPHPVAAGCAAAPLAAAAGARAPAGRFGSGSGRGSGGCARGCWSSFPQAARPRAPCGQRQDTP